MYALSSISSVIVPNVYNASICVRVFSSEFRRFSNVSNRVVLDGSTEVPGVPAGLGLGAGCVMGGTQEIEQALAAHERVRTSSERLRNHVG